jgi:DNA-binding SARP family transcriptional activator
MVFHEYHGNAERGLTCGRAILACDNTRERIHRRMMRLHWQAGNRSMALAQYKICAQTLQDTLSVAPLAKTTRLYQQMKHDCFDPALWPGQQCAPQATQARSGATAPLVAEDAIQRLHQLHKTVEQVSAELRLIEQSLSQICQPPDGDR